jgi:hypothetical protein
MYLNRKVQPLTFDVYRTIAVCPSTLLLPVQYFAAVFAKETFTGYFTEKLNTSTYK